MDEVLLVGNPNAGKTTLFNSLTRSNEHVGNWHGVTVENKKKVFKVADKEFVLVDTPGIYSLCPLSFEEKVAVDTIFERRRKIINICDQNNIKRNLYLTLCLLESGADVVLAVNEIDKKPIYKVDYGKLAECLGIEVVGINAEKKFGTEELKSCLLETKNGNGSANKLLFKESQKTETEQNFEEENEAQFERKREFPKRLKYLKNLKIDENLLKNLEKNEKNAIFGDFYAILKAYERDENYFSRLGISNCEKIFALVPKDSVQILAKLRFDFIDEILTKCAVRTDAVYGKSKFDKILLNKWLAFPIFILILAGIFWLTFFSVGSLFSDLLGSLLETLTNPILKLIENAFGQSAIYDLFNVAIFGGVGTVLSFLPQVVLLFFFLSLLEDSGYMSRVAFIFEDILGKIGLSGKSVYTLLMGFGCSTTAIMTSRNMEDKNAKIKTAILCPYMSCSAKIPIYTVIGGAFFGANNIFVIVGLYFLGVAVAIAISAILNKTILKSGKQSFILEFPPYRMMSAKRIGKVLWKNVKEFLVRVGTVMVAMNVIIWVLSSFSFTFSYVGGGAGVSMLETIGRIFAPIFKPLGFGSWAIVSSLLAGLVAKEVVVSSIAMFNGIDVSAMKLISASILLPTSVVHFASGASVASFLIFCLLYTPCIASISMLMQEIGGKWTLVSIALQFFAAYVVSFVTYNIFLAFEVFGFMRPFVTLFVIAISVVFIVKKSKNGNLCAHCERCQKKCLKKKK